MSGSNGGSALYTLSTSHRKMVWLPCATSLHTQQLNAARDEASIGAPVSRLTQSPVVNRSLRREERQNESTKSWSAVDSRFTQTTPEALIALCAEALWLMQISSVGGSALTELTAVAMSPARSPSAEVVMSVTPETSRRIPALKSSAKF